MNLPRLALATSLAFAASLQHTSADPSPLQKSLVKGISAWSYSQRDSRVFEAVRSYNAKVPDAWKFQYFFPYAGSLEVDQDARKVHVYYNPKNTEEGTPAGATPIPIMDARVEKDIFSGWTDAQYRGAAEQTADAIAKDLLAKGAQIDIEPFSMDHLPFYRHLRTALNSKGKILTMFVGPKGIDAMKEIFQSCDVVVISGYDSSGLNPGPDRFQNSLSTKLANVQLAAEAIQGRYMIGIPAAAAWGEYEYRVDASGANRQNTGHSQEAYMQAALNACDPFLKKPECLGVALWELSRSNPTDEPEKVTKTSNMPNHIRPSIWKILSEHANRQD